MKPGTSFLVTFYDAKKRVVDTALIRAASRNEARTTAVTLYAKNGDKASYAGFIVTEEKHGGY